jgi:hypothetical protein
LTPVIELWVFGSPGGLPSSHFKSVSVILTLLQSGVTTQRVMNHVLKGAYFLKCYIDDILVHNKRLLQHLAHLEELLKRFHKVNMKIQLLKCEFVVTSVVYFGHKFFPNGIMAHWAKGVTILEMSNPTNVHTLKSFIGLCNYHKILCPRFQYYCSSSLCTV